MKWLIVEDALRDRKGHWLEYVSTFVRELRALGDEVVVLCDQKAQGFVMEQTGARPVLPESIWHRMGDGAGALKRYLRVPAHAVATFFAMRKFFKKFNHRGHGVGGKREIKCETGRMDEAQCNAQEICAGAFESDSLTSKLAESPVSESPIRCANGPASSPVTSHSLQATTPEASLPATSYPLPATSSLPDWIFVPTVLVHHLLGWWMLLKTGSVPRESRVLLFFPNLPIQLDDMALAHWSGGPTTKLMAWLFGQLRNEVESGRVVLGVETHAMRRALAGLIGMKVTYLPHPVPAKSGREERGVERRESRASSPATSNPLPATAAKPLVFGCYGAARWEKGSDIFQEAIKLILKNEVASGGCRVASVEDKAEPVTRDPLPATAAGRPLRFAIQWVEDFTDDNGNLVKLDPWLKNHPQVEVIGRYFQGDEYGEQLERTDVMVLPYRKPYRLRVSRVVIEAMLNGLPVIVTRGTTLFEQAEEYGVVVGCEGGDAESLAMAMLEVAEDFEMMSASSEEKVDAAAESFSVAFFRDLLARNW